MKLRDAKRFHLEIYRQSRSSFTDTGITHINLLSCGVAFEMQKVWKTRLPKTFPEQN